METKKPKKQINPKLYRFLSEEESEKEHEDHVITEEEEDIVPDDTSQEVWTEENPADVEDSRRRSI